MTASTAPGSTVPVSTKAIDRHAAAHDASHYLLVPAEVARPGTAQEVADLLVSARDRGLPVTFRSGGTSLSGQGVTAGVLADTRHAFRTADVLDGGARVRVQPGMTVRQVNGRLARHGRKLGPDPASEIACTIGGVVANNSSGMACGIEQNTYRTLESLVVVLPSGTVLDTSLADADERLRAAEPELHAGLLALRDRVRADPESVATIERFFAMKNTMGYGINAFLDFDIAVDILTHLIIGSEGTLGFVAEAVFRTVTLQPAATTALAVFATLREATAALPAIVATGAATVELMDSTSLRLAAGADDAPAELRELEIDDHAAFLIEFHGPDARAAEGARADAAPVFDALPLSLPLRFTTDPGERAALWHIRKGLYTTVAEARAPGTTALLEDVVVPVPTLLDACAGLRDLFAAHGYEDSVIFGHAKDGNIHFMLSERLGEQTGVDRYRAFTDDMVELILGLGGSLKAEHGTGRIMAPFVRRQYGDELYAVMREVKRLFDPHGILNPGVLLSDDPDSYLRDLKTAPAVEEEVDRCVECGYCEPACPSRDLTLTPRQRIVLRRELRAAELAGDDALAAELRNDYDYAGVQTCAVDGMCQTACPVNINTGDLVRRLRGESASRVASGTWDAAAAAWGPVSRAGGVALTIAEALPVPLVRAATDVGRAILGADTVPRYEAGLPRGGKRRSPRASAEPQAVFFAACIGTMFGAEGDGMGSTSAFLALCERAGVEVTVPDGISSMCCGTPWKSKGFHDGHERMSERVLPALLAASRGGELPVVCDAASCTEGLEALRDAAVKAGGDYDRLRFVDSVDFAATTLLPGLDVVDELPSLVLHPTCSTQRLGVDGALRRVAEAVAADVTVPIDAGCCAFAGDRGLLHPELTASATEREAAEVGVLAAEAAAAGTVTAYASANRTCELGMSRATGQRYRHILELVEEATRPTPAVPAGRSSTR
ncbi:FAD-binding and (Fe-S)-binding domain-containing protein [Leifsonia sp. NPDC058194]|uniref:FAD-binding and (Fe-S)-binding domain-containing protein n=1 Tax=Leifsonia sp. NPDC058194 TaxID=3346374 RepID=UPI0036DA93BA